MRQTTRGTRAIATQGTQARDTSGVVMSYYMKIRSARSIMAGLATAAILISGTPISSQAQFGRLKQLKNAISPDSAAKAESAIKDSIALAAKLAAGDTTPLQRSKFARAVSAAGAASEKFEAVTGVSAKDAALVATGVGASGLIAKKLGADPMRLGASAINSAKARSASKINAASVMQGMQGGQGVSGIPGMPNMAELMRMQQGASAHMQAAAQSTSTVPSVVGQAPLGFTEADARVFANFQQEMMQVAMAASGGDAAAQAKLEKWEAVALKYEPEIEKLTVAASAGDYTAVQKLQVIQVNIIKEWSGISAGKPVKVVKAAAKPAKATKP